MSWSDNFQTGSLNQPEGVIEPVDQVKGLVDGQQDRETGLDQGARRLRVSRQNGCMIAQRGGGIIQVGQARQIRQLDLIVVLGDFA